MSKALRHFLDLNELPTRELSNMLALSVAMKALWITCLAPAPAVISSLA